MGHRLATDGLLAGAEGGMVVPTASTKLADAALANLMGSIDAFGLTGSAAKPPAAASNPFDGDNVHANKTLGEIQGKNAERKAVMNAPPGAGAMVMANQQVGNWGGQVQSNTQYGLGGSMQPQQQAAPQYATAGGYQPQQPPIGIGQSMPMQGQPPMGMGQSMPMQGQMPMQPPMQQGYATPQYGQQPPTQQHQWGAPSY